MLYATMASWRRQPVPATVCLFQAAFVGNGQFPAALFAAAREDFAAVFRLHALAEAMFVLTGASGRLVGTFHR